MLITIIAPEFILGKVCADLASAKVDLEEFKEFAKQDNVPWTLTHSLLANMGGFIIRSNVERLRSQSNDAATQTSLSEEIEETQQEGPLRDKHLDNLSSYKVPRTKPYEYNNPLYLNAPDVLLLRKSGLLPRLPHITVEDINDKSKSDNMVRVIAIVQFTWTVVQAIARAARHLAVSQLEIAVIAFAVCAIIIYALNWSKPKGIQIPYTLLQYKGEIPAGIRAIIESDEFGQRNGSWITGMLSGLRIAVKPKKGEPWSNSEQVGNDNVLDAIGLLIGSVAFGGLHLVAWDFIFPTRIEQILWRAASILCTTLFLGALSCLVIFRVFAEYGMNLSDAFGQFFTVALPSILYVLARLFLMVEIFRSLLFLPLSAFVGTWVANIPHVA